MHHLKNEKSMPERVLKFPFSSVTKSDRAFKTMPSVPETCNLHTKTRTGDHKVTPKQIQIEHTLAAKREDGVVY